MKDKILEIIKNKPKHFSQIIKRDVSLMDFIQKNKTVSSNILAEEIYSVIYNESNICPLGNTKKFNSFNDGYRFCGPANRCECTKKLVSSSVKKSKSKTTTQEQKLINEKRANTNLKMHGVTNAGQTEQAKNTRSELYNNANRVQQLVAQVSDTKKERYGNANYNNSKKISETWKEKKASYFIDLYPDKDLESLYDKEQFTKLYDSKPIEELAEYLGVHVQTVYRYSLLYGLRNKFVSSLEKEMVIFLKSIGVENIVQNSRKIIGKELDIYLPEYDIAIEMNGLYWHHDQISYIDRQYHKSKFIECEKKGIQLLTIFSDIWENKKEIIKRTISHKLGLCSRKSVMARKTKVTTLESSQIKDFLNENHIQGYTPSKYVYALEYDEQIIAVMTFSLPRTGIGKKRSNTVELVRYATSVNIPGGASKLLKHFLNDYPAFKSVISYSDNEWSTGELYKSLNFELEKTQPPSYFYFHPAEKVRKHRYNFTKYKLIQQGYDETLTESEIQRQRGYLRIWDCGKRTWIYNNT
jgi:hypothetical protein